MAKAVGDYMVSDEAIDAGLKGFVGGTSLLLLVAKLEQR